jgi:integrase
MAMPKRSEISFTEKTVKTNKPREKRYEIWDRQRPGLFLRIMPTGTKSYYVALNRKLFRKVGDANQLTLATAWTKAKKMMGKYEDGEKFRSSRDECTTLRKYLKGKYMDFAKANQKTGEANVARLLSAAEPLMKTRMDKLSEFQIEKWKAGRLKAVKPTTVRRDLAVLKAALNKAVKWTLIEFNPSAHVQVRVPTDNRVRYLCDKERQRLVEAMKERDKEKARARHSGNLHRLERDREPLPEITGYADYLTPLILLTMHTGMRRGEVLSLTWPQVNLGSNPRVTVKAGYSKSNKTRHIPLNTQAVAVMKKWSGQGSSKGLVFPNPITGQRMKKMKSSWLNLLRDADLQDFRFHDLRHDFASQLVMKGADLYRVKELLGHGSIEITQRYAHLAPHTLAEAVELLA